MRRGIVLTVCLLLLSTSLARAEFYRWVDKDGKEFFTNEREQVPKEYQEYRNGSESGRKPSQRGREAGCDRETGNLP